MNWLTVAALIATTRREDVVLILYVSRGGDFGPWTVACLETPAVPKGAPTLDAARAVFANHAHEILDPVGTLVEALALGERYAKWWRSSRASHFSCACEPITARDGRTLIEGPEAIAEEAAKVEAQHGEDEKIL